MALTMNGSSYGALASVGERRELAPMNILLIHDQPLFSLGVVHALTAVGAPVDIRTAQTLDQGIEQATRWPHLDAVLIHERLAVMPNMYGLRCVTFKCPNVAPLLFADSADPDFVAQAHASGALAVLRTTSSPSELWRALEAVFLGRSSSAYRPPTGQVVVRLTPTRRQLEVLNLIAHGRQNKQIAWELGIAERTVKLHVTALLSTTGARNRTHLLVRAKEIGLL